jgi:hypothetical protein
MKYPANFEYAFYSKFDVISPLLLPFFNKALLVSTRYNKQ